MKIYSAEEWKELHIRQLNSERVKEQEEHKRKMRKAQRDFTKSVKKVFANIQKGVIAPGLSMYVKGVLYEKYGFEQYSRTVNSELIVQNAYLAQFLAQITNKGWFVHCVLPVQGDRFGEHEAYIAIDADGRDRAESVSSLIQRGQNVYIWAHSDTLEGYKWFVPTAVSKDDPVCFEVESCMESAIWLDRWGVRGERGEKKERKREVNMDGLDRSR